MIKGSRIVAHAALQDFVENPTEIDRILTFLEEVADRSY